MEKSRWLREERDEDWSKNFGRDSYSQDFSAEQEGGNFKGVNHGIALRSPINEQAINPGKNDMQLVSNNRVLIQDNPIFGGPTNEELVGLNLEERKRRRSSPTDELMDTNGGGNMSITEPGFSRDDYTGSSSNLQAQLAQQASRAL
ncbi:hypothetical protein POM88_021346 [Heracleum sosnowskyi]|uniref:Uncharacterized protein n=1 Tax=Heracleum sosnowskyi TaxID=360622 RepID=A0AAD8MSD9_9APIA|nr:hypothetical protein POM88_021346 [Heracleum sosnowskyi]